MFKLIVRDGEKSYEITLRRDEHGNDVWVENEGGEGMSMSEKNLFDWLDRGFKEEF